ncbi:MAG TPA: hypothetical protein VMW23_04465, partial [Sedimentisphaerales bacterium]|nr:hypothetical protein [Sedimentisphaerales bacterium]
LNCTFYGNTAGTDGAAMSISSSSPQISNCILWNNTVDASEDEVYIDTPFTTFSHCDIYGCGGSDNWQQPGFGIDGGGNIDADPDFPIDEPGYEFGPEGEDDTWATEDDGLMPGPKSPCINAADFWLPGPWGNITGEARRAISPYPDMGAYESKYKIMLVMCFIDETQDESYHDDENEYNTDLGNFNNLLAGFPYSTNYSILKAGCIVPPTDEEDPYHPDKFRQDISDVLPESFFYPPDPPEILWPEEKPVGLSIAQCNDQPSCDELIAHFNRLCEGKNPDCILRLLDGTHPLYGFFGLGDGYRYEFKQWLEDWVADHGLDPADTSLLPDQKVFGPYWYPEQWIKAITDTVDAIVNP